MIAPASRPTPVLVRSAVGVVLVAAAFMIMASCDDVPLTAPTESKITLYVNASTLALGGETDVTATVVEAAGTAAHDGTVVTFTTNLGTLDPPEAKTKGGKATTKFRAGTVSGTASIGAFSGPAVAEKVELKVGGAAAETVLLNVSPAYVSASGGTVQLSATVVDVDGNRLPSVAVTFTASAGTLNPASATTDAAGEAKSSLTTNRETTVKATAGAKSSSDVTVRVNQAPSVAITTTTPSPQAGQPVAFTVTVTPTAGVAVNDVRIDFGDGSSASLGSATNQAISHVYKTAGNFTVSATASDTNGERATASTVVVVTALQIQLAVSYSPTRPVFNNPVTISVTVSPATVTVRSYSFDFGDGTTATITNNTISHTYTTTGIKTVRIAVETVDGQVVTTLIDIPVNAT